MRSTALGSIVAVALSAPWLTAAPASADPAVAQAQIVTSGRGELTIPPTQARFSVTVTTNGPTAAVAGSDNARVSRAVTDSLAAAGLTREELLGTRLSVNAKWEYDERGRRKGRTTYEANNTLRIESARLEHLGVLVDAALGAGATSVSDMEFYARNVSATRRQALTLAVEDARAEADTIARAAGGTLGELLGITTERAGPAPGGFEDIMVTAQRRTASAPEPTNVTPTDIVVSAQVNARWTFVATRR